MSSSSVVPVRAIPEFRSPRRLRPGLSVHTSDVPTTPGVWAETLIRFAYLVIFRIDITHEILKYT